MWNWPNGIDTISRIPDNIWGWRVIQKRGVDEKYSAWLATSGIESPCGKSYRNYSVRKIWGLGSTTRYYLYYVLFCIWACCCWAIMSCSTLLSYLFSCLYFPFPYNCIIHTHTRPCRFYSLHNSINSMHYYGKPVITNHGASDSEGCSETDFSEQWNPYLHYITELEY